MSPFRGLLALGLAGLLAAPCIRAVTVVAPTFPELVASADTIVRATVTARRCEMRSTSQGRAIFTITTLRVESRLKGTGTESLELTQLGGEIGEERMVIPGLPRFAEGDRDILFIAGNGRTYCPLVGAPHGRYPIVTEAKSGLHFVMRADGRPLDSTTAVVSPLGAEPSEGASASAATLPLSLEQFEAAIREEVNRQATAAQNAR